MTTPTLAERLSEWQEAVLKAEGLADWTLKVAADAYCWIDRKTIQLPPDCPAALFLHEVAHALYPLPEGEFNNHYHGGGWASTYGQLVEKYMAVRAWAGPQGKEEW